LDFCVTNRYEVGLDQPSGVVVVLTINGTKLPMTYDTANRLAVMLRGFGRIAKQNAGDLSIKVIGFAHLTDGVLDELKLQQRRDRTAVFAKVG
jgi:hypothetical protein